MREELGWKCAFEIYYGSKSNHGINGHHGYNVNSVESVSTTAPTTCIIKAHQKKVSSMKKLQEAYGKGMK